jgi:thioesterase domain-containing protein
MLTAALWEITRRRSSAWALWVGSWIITFGLVIGLPARCLILIKLSGEPEMITIGSLQKYLHERIPISKAMGVEVLEATLNGVKLAAPLSPNINHRETVFGGSASAVAILSAWSLLYLRLKNENINCRIVIQRNTITYEHPITDMFSASSVVCDPSVWLKFIITLKRKNRARVKINSILHCNDRKVGEFGGDFVAIASQTA